MKMQDEIDWNQAICKHYMPNNLLKIGALYIVVDVVA